MEVGVETDEDSSGNKRELAVEAGDSRVGSAEQFFVVQIAFFPSCVHLQSLQSFLNTCPGVQLNNSETKN